MQFVAAVVRGAVTLFKTAIASILSYLTAFADGAAALMLVACLISVFAAPLALLGIFPDQAATDFVDRAREATAFVTVIAIFLLYCAKTLSFIALPIWVIGHTLAALFKASEETHQKFGAVIGGLLGTPALFFVIPGLVTIPIGACAGRFAGTLHRRLVHGESLHRAWIDFGATPLLLRILIRPFRRALGSKPSPPL